jgi:hypothetical protein
MNPRAIILEALTILSSFSTLLCCALPAALVSIGAGAALASIVTAVPQLVWLSEHKIVLFVFAGIMLTLSGVLAYRNRNAPWPARSRAGKVLYATTVLVGAHLSFLRRDLRDWIPFCVLRSSARSVALHR